MGQSDIDIKQQERVSDMRELLRKSDSIYLNEGDIKIEEALLLKADSLSVGLKFIKDTLSLTIKKNLGFIYMDTDNNDKAIHYFTQALEIAEEQKLRDDYIQALMYVGQGHAKKMEFDKAVPFLEKSLALLDEKDSEKYPDMKANVLINLGLAHFDNNKIDDAFLLLNKALILAKRDGDKENELVIYNNLSICYSDLDQHKKANQYIMKALAINDANNLGQFSEPYDNLGCNYIELKQYDSAAYYFEKGHKIASEKGDQNGVSSILAGMGWMYIKQKKYSNAISYLKNAYRLADSLKNIEVAMESSMHLSEALEETKAHSEALVYLKKSFLHKKSIAANKVEKKLEEFNVKYKTLEKEEKIASLNKENELNQIIFTQKQRQKKTLGIVFALSLLLLSLGAWVWYRIDRKTLLEKQQNLRFKSIIKTEQKERKRIAEDLYSSIGQSISELKEQVETLQPKADNQQAIHNKLRHQIDQVYDDLRNVSYNIMPNTLITLGLIPALEELVNDIQADSSLEIKLNNETNLKDLNDIQTINLFRIIQESLVNIIKHAKASLVTIEFLCDKGMTHVSIKDNGIGMTSSIIKNQQGIGWKNIFSRVALLSGNINVVSQPNQGTSITVSIK